MIKRILILILVFCSFAADAQIKTRRNYDYIGHEVNSAGLRVVGLKSEERSDGKYYYTEDHWTSEPVLYGCIDSNGNEVITIQYKTIVLGKDIDYIYAIRPEFGWKNTDGTSGSWVQTEWLFTADGKHSIGNALGESRAACAYTKLYPNSLIFKRFKCSISQIHNKKYGIINVDDSKTISPIYDELFWINYDKGYLAANLGGYWGIIDYLGREIVAHQWSDLKKLDNTFCAGKLNDLWGIFDNDGNEIVPFQFNEIKACKDNIAIVVSNDEYGAYDLINRKQIIPFGLYYSILDFNGKTFWGRFFQSNAYVMQLYSIDGTVLNDLSNISNKYRNKKRYSEISVESRDGVKEISIYDEKNDDERWIHYYYDDLGREYTDFKLAKAANDSIRKSDIIMIESNVLASINWHSGTEPVQDKVYNLVVSAQSRSDIQEVYLVVNGTTHKDLGIIKMSDHDLTIKKEIALIEGANSIKVCVRNAAGTTQEERTILYRPQSDDRLVSIEWLAFDPSNEKNERLMKLGIKSKSKIEDVTITINGSQARGVKTVASDQYDMVIEHPITLVEGTNRIVVSVRNSEGIVTKERSEYYSDITPTPVFHDKRIALIIGNSDYSKPEMKLKNPINDARDIAEKLEKLGFHVILKLDATLSEMNAALADFELQAVEYDMALFYFAGHGIQSKGENFLLPTNIDYLTEGNLSTFCLPASQVMNQMEATNCKLNIAVFDACRNDPLSRQWRRGSGLRGLSMMDSPDGTIIAFSTAPGHTASDGTDRNSPYTEAFLEALDHPGLSIRDFFPTVGELVKKKTNKMQTPWMSTCFTGDFYFNPK